MIELTKEDLPHEAYWTLYSLLDELPTRIDSSSESEFLHLPDAVKLAVALNWNFDTNTVRACDIPTHYNYMMGRLQDMLSKASWS